MNTEPTSILAFRNGSIGNTLVAVPALRAIHNQFPSAKISVVVDSVGYQLLEHCPWIEQLILYEKRKQHRSLLAHIPLIRELRATKPSHAILFKRFFRNGLLAYLSGAKQRFGFETNGKAPFLTSTTPYDESVNIIEMNLRLAGLLGAHGYDNSLEMFLTPNDNLQADELIKRHLSGDKKFVVVHYGGLTTAPDFLAAPRFAELIRNVTLNNWRVISIGSGANERQWNAQLATEMPSLISALDLPIRVMAALVKRSFLFVGFNSGPAHIAASTQTPTLILYRPDSRVSAEIAKWCPPFSHVRALVPPASAEDSLWQKFLVNARSKAEAILTFIPEH